MAFAYPELLKMQVLSILRELKSSLEEDYSPVGDSFLEVFTKYLEAQAGFRIYATKQDYIEALVNHFPFDVSRDCILSETLLDTVIGNLAEKTKETTQANADTLQPLVMWLGRGELIAHEGIYDGDYAFILTSAKEPVEVGASIKSGRCFTAEDDVKLVLKVADPLGIKSIIEVLKALEVRVTYSAPIVVTKEDGSEELIYPT